jgi:hypothetical protein
MMKDLRAKAAARIQLQLSADLHRTGGVESELNGQLRQLVGAATSATPKMQRASDLAADITRLQARYASVDEQIHNLLLEDKAPAAAYQATAALPPLGRTKSGVLRNAVLIAFSAFLERWRRTRSIPGFTSPQTWSWCSASLRWRSCPTSTRSLPE